MFKNSKFKKMIFAALGLVMILSTMTIAAENIYQKQLTATYGRIKFELDGRDVTQDIENKYGTPAFVVDGRSYAPVKAIADLMGVDVVYDETTHTAKLINTKVTELSMELLKRDMEINNLKKELEDLKKKSEEVKKEEPKKEESKKEETKKEITNLQDLEKRLNADFASYKNVTFNIKLRQSANRISADISTNLPLRKEESYWNAMTHNDKKTLSEEIVYEIDKYFPNNEIFGYIYDDYYRKNTLTFNKSKWKGNTYLDSFFKVM